MEKAVIKENPKFDYTFKKGDTVPGFIESCENCTAVFNCDVGVMRHNKNIVIYPINTLKKIDGVYEAIMNVDIIDKSKRIIIKGSPTLIMNRPFNKIDSAIIGLNLPY